jgi:hypothetical protein
MFLAGRAAGGLPCSFPPGMLLLRYGNVFASCVMP